MPFNYDPITGIRSWYPMTNVTPFTYRDGTTYLQYLEQITKKLNLTIKSQNDLGQDVAEAIDNQDQIIADMVAETQQWAANTEILQDQAVTSLINDPDSDTREALDLLYASSTVQSVNGHSGVVVLDSDDVGAVESVDTPSSVYATNPSGNDSVITYTDQNTPNTIPQRNSLGVFQIGAPSNNADAANKQYVDNAVSGVTVSTIGAVPTNSTPNSVYANNSSGVLTPLDYTPNPLLNTIPIRNASGVFQIGAPSNNADAANKQYVDNAVSAGLGGQFVGDTGKKYQVIAGALRRQAGVWSVISDSEHGTIGGVTVEESGTSDIKVNFPSGIGKINTFIVAPDEALAREQITVGSSVGLDSAIIQGFKPVTISGYLENSGTTWSVVGNENVAVGTVSGSFVEITHNAIMPTKTSEIIGSTIAKGDHNAGYMPAIGTYLDNNRFTVSFWNMSSGTIINPTTNTQSVGLAVFMRQGVKKMVHNDYQISNANLWFVGIFEIDE